MGPVTAADVSARNAVVRRGLAGDRLFETAVGQEADAGYVGETCAVVCSPAVRPRNRKEVGGGRVADPDVGGLSAGRDVGNVGTAEVTLFVGVASGAGRAAVTAVAGV